MPEMQRIFEDNSSVTWVDRETLRYQVGDRYVLVWVDYEPGFFKRGRVIRGSSLGHWEKIPGQEGLVEISLSERLDIIAKIRAYFSNERVRVQNEP